MDCTRSRKLWWKQYYCPDIRALCFVPNLWESFVSCFLSMTLLEQRRLLMSELHQTYRNNWRYALYPVTERWLSNLGIFPEENSCKFFGSLLHTGHVLWYFLMVIATTSFLFRSAFILLHLLKKNHLILMILKLE